MELQVSRLCKAYGGKTVLRDLSFTAGPGVTCVMAPSGGGKTTLLRILLGLETADSGTVTGAQGARWSAVFQEDRLLGGRTARENLHFVLGRDYEEERAAECLAALGLSDTEDKAAGDFSGGMKRRLALARALLAPADLLALDEPFTGLDAESRRRAVDCLRGYTAGKPVLLVTHDVRDAQELQGTILRL